MKLCNWTYPLFPAPGKIKGDLPDKVPKGWCPDKIKDAIEDAQRSIRQRTLENAEQIAEQRRNGVYDWLKRWVHQARIRDELDWLRKLKAALPRGRGAGCGLVDPVTTVTELYEIITDYEGWRYRWDREGGIIGGSIILPLDEHRHGGYGRPPIVY